MMKKKHVEFHMDGILALLIFGVFAACVLTVLLFGAKAYKGITRRDAAAYDERTALQYVATRVRQNDRQGEIGVSEFDGVNCLTLWDRWGDASYVTRVYCYDGSIRELYAEVGTDLTPEAGEEILEAEGLDFTLSDGLLTVTATTHGKTETLTLSLRSDEREVWP